MNENNYNFYFILCKNITLFKDNCTAHKLKLSVRVSLVNVTKHSAICGFGHIYWTNSYWKTIAQ